jgi:hypothetical protein
MIRRGVALVAGAVALVLGATAGAAYAATTTDVGSFGLDVKQVQETYSSPATGSMQYSAQCPSGYSAIGGGGLAIPSIGNSRIPMQGSAPYDNGNVGWGVTFDVPASSWTVYVYASCMKIT